MAGLSSTELAIGGVLALLVLLALWASLRRRPRVRAETVDVLTPGAAPAARNTLLVDAPSAVPSPSAEILGGVAPAVDKTVLADAGADAGDDLTRIKGLGPKIATLLHGLNVTRFDQIAAWDTADVARMDEQLGAFRGRIERDNWVEQAGYLAAGDVSGFEARFGKV